MSLINRTTVATGTVVVAVAVAVVGFVATRDEGVDKVYDARVYAVRGTATSTELEVLYAAGTNPGCADPYGVQVSESSQSITLTARTVTRAIPEEGRACPLAEFQVKGVVKLKSPLGDRKVLDAFQLANGQPGIVEVRAS